MTILSQFLLRLSFGLATGMALTASRHVDRGFFRVHLYVVLGLCTLASLVASGAEPTLPLWPPLTAAILSYVGSVLWLADQRRLGQVALVLVALTTLTGALLASPWSSTLTPSVRWLSVLAVPTSGLVVGLTVTSMLLGHWYLNSPTMELLPLQRLLRWTVTAVLVRLVLCGVALWLQGTSEAVLNSPTIALLAIRWLGGLLGLLWLLGMAWQTLKIPNTQSATGILYVAFVGAIGGELASQLLSVESLYPL